MKKVTLRTAILSGILTAAPAFASNETACKTIEQEISRVSGDFVKISSLQHTQFSKRTSPSDLYRGAQTKSAQLQQSADLLWDLRTEMANKRCNQAERFTF